MAIKIFSLVLAVILALFALETVSCDENINQPDVLFIQNPDTVPIILSRELALSVPQRNNLVCSAAMCRNVCQALGYRFGLCNINRICICTNL